MEREGKECGADSHSRIRVRDYGCQSSNLREGGRKTRTVGGLEGLMEGLREGRRGGEIVESIGFLMTQQRKVRQATRSLAIAQIRVVASSNVGPSSGSC